MRQLNDFFNDGFGWKCRYCYRESGREPDPGPSRLLFEGEAEEKGRSRMQAGLAKWTDATRRYLICPNCGIRELAELQ